MCHKLLQNCCLAQSADHYTTNSTLRETHAELTCDDSTQLYAIPKLTIGEVWSSQAGGDIIPPNI